MSLFIITILAFLISIVSGQIRLEGCSGWNSGRQICVQGTLYLDGTVAAEVTTVSHSLLHGCKGGAIAVGVDAAGNALWSALLEGKTACGKGDIFCRNRATKAVVTRVDAELTPKTVRVDFYYEFNVNTLHGRQLEWLKVIMGLRQTKKERDSL
ncbi:hypothetical protein FRB94_013075 [Tulasnella sp. JGI-2019a]|nr:hypothetical protein FRB93_001846 [Tulasnella sp. JGI-2019a]KAG9008668.1 hypothetical protein FRB94_013075 [Tulasnella sp. JGI-2019a]KAG9033860.1 hypothetical protein FRB95_014182 [Tulasnella sp. JGI-2019a]